MKYIMSEVKKPKEWRLLDAGLNQNINSLKQEFRIAMYQENFGLIEGVTIPVIEKSAYDKAIEALKDIKSILQPCLKEPERGAFWKAVKTLKELGCE